MTAETLNKALELKEKIERFRAELSKIQELEESPFLNCVINGSKRERRVPIEYRSKNVDFIRRILIEDRNTLQGFLEKLENEFNSIQ